ncbi:hypothetical protein E8E14_012433 [Neopestalotiopsis sp. 37M]|nr:hypothetical protein E8E14_012433 [Neopestalotiopsis sp. 37M]
MTIPTFARPRELQHTPIDVLVHAYNSKCLAINKLAPCGPDLADFHDGDVTQYPRTFLQPPASEEAIKALDRTFRDNGFPNGMPEDVGAFYRVTNGIFSGDDGASGGEIFRPAEHVEVMTADDVLWPCELLPFIDDDNRVGLDLTLEWPEMQHAVQLGAGGDEGTQLLVPPEMTKKAIAVAEKAWKDGDDKTKRILEEIAEKIYGGWEDMKKLEVAVIRVYHWAAETESFSSFKHMLEAYVMDAGNTKADDGNDGGDEGEDGADGDETIDDNSAVEEVDDDETQDEDEEDDKELSAGPQEGADALKDRKIIFTGTFETMDRKTCEAKAKEHGAQLTRKLADADYVVVGTRAGPKKLEEISNLGLKTIDEQQFLALLGNEDSEPLPAKAKAPKPAQTKAEDSKPVPQTKKDTTKSKVNSGAGPVSKDTTVTLAGKKILFTGTFDTMDRKQAKQEAEKHGAKVISAIPKGDGLDFIVLGANAGPNKLKEIEDRGLQTVTEQEFLEMTDNDGEKTSSQGKKRANPADSEPKQAKKRQRVAK